MTQQFVHNIVPGEIAPQALATNGRPAALDMRSGGTGLPSRAVPAVAHSAAVMEVAIRYANEATALATELMAHGLTKDHVGLTVADLAALGVPRLKELRTTALVTREFTTYDVNAVMEAEFKR